jgi:hypothetical protein
MFLTLISDSFGRWHRLGAKYVAEYNGKPADPKRALRNLVDDVLEMMRKALSGTRCGKPRPISEKLPAT